MTDMKLVDQAERDKITDVLNKNFLVEAGAGSGKTYSLVQRMVNLIVTGTYEIGEIVAITFTRKAADELKERFQTGLEKRRKETTDRLQKERIERALANFDQCYLGTVHSFCGRILRERPIEAGLDFDFSELDEKEDAQLVDEAWDRYIQHVRLYDRKKIDELVELGFDIANLRTSIHHLREYGDVHWHYDEVEKPSLQEAFAELKKFIEYTKGMLPEEEPDKGYDSLQKKIIKTIRQLKYANLEQEKTIVNMLRPYEKKSSVTLNRWKDKDEAKEVRDEIQLVLVEVVEDTLRKWYEYCHNRLIPFLKPALEVYEQLKIERSSLNFQDLLVHTAKLLKNNSEVRAYFQKKYRCLLVDEFQDTDPIQAEIMLYLTGEELDETNWTRLTPRQGSLFVVGDPKQSIYRFRRADIDIYQRVKEIITNTGGEVLHLIMNFRTVDTITKPLNNVFVKQLPEKETTYQAAYRELVSVKTGVQNEDEFQGVFEHMTPYSRKSRDVVEQDAEAIAKYIRKVLDEGLREPKDFMILTRYNSSLKDYANMLQQYGIPVMTTGEITLAQDEKLQALSHLIKLLAQPTNSLYFTAVLRGPFFGISDRLLYEHQAKGGNLALFTSISDELAEEDKQLLEQALTKLKKYYDWRRKLLPTAAIEKVIYDVGLLPLYLNSEQPKREFTRLFQVLERLRQHEASGHSGFHEVSERLYNLIQEEMIEEMTLPNEQNAVVVMNVHKSKGLEAPIVFLVEPNKFVDNQNRIIQHIKRQDEHSIGYFAFFNEKGETMAIPCNWQEYKEEEYNYLQAEEIRLLYVASTRAKEMLIVSKMDRNNEKNNPWHLLIEDMDLVPLTISEEVEKRVNDNVQNVDVNEYLSAVETLSNWQEPLTESSYSKYSPTDDTEELPFDVERTSGGGLKWGTVIHEVFEYVLKEGEHLQEKVLSLLKREQLSESRYDEVIQVVEQFMQSSLYKELETSTERYSEMSFSFKLNEGDPLYPKNKKGDVHVSGVIDFIYKLDDGWTIIDFKTDHVEKEEDIEKLTRHYAKQLLFYKAAFERLTNEKVHKTKLYFVTPNKVVDV